MLRYAEKFVGNDGSTTWTIPLTGYEYEPSQDWEGAYQQMVAKDYVHDFLDDLPALAAPGTEVVRFKLINDTAINLDLAFDTLVATLKRGGKGKLWSLGADGTRRWCYARCVGRPSYRLAVRQDSFTYVSVSFRKLSDWFGETQITGTVTLTSTPISFTITNTGLIRVKTGILFTYRASANPNGFTTPRLENLTLNQRVDTTRTSTSATDRLQYNCDAEQSTIQYSAAGGAYVDDWTSATLLSPQIPIMELEAGANNMRATDFGASQHAFLDYAFYPAFG